MVDFVISLVMGGTFLLVGATLTVVLQPRAARVWFLATGLLLAVAAVLVVAVVGASTTSCVQPDQPASARRWRLVTRTSRIAP